MNSFLNTLLAARKICYLFTYLSEHVLLLLLLLLLGFQSDIIALNL